MDNPYFLVICKNTADYTLINSDNVNVYSPDSWTLLHCAVSYQKEDNIKHLLSLGADTFLLDKSEGERYSGLAPLHTAVFGSVSIVKQLLNAGANVNIKSSVKATPLELLAASDCVVSVEMIELLVNRRATLRGWIPVRHRNNINLHNINDAISARFKREEAALVVGICLKRTKFQKDLIALIQYWIKQTFLAEWIL